MKPKMLQCNRCGNGIVSVKFNGKYYCSKCFEKLYDQKKNEIKVLPGFVPQIHSKTRQKKSWRTSVSKREYLKNIPVDMIEI